MIIGICIMNVIKGMADGRVDMNSLTKTLPHNSISTLPARSVLKNIVLRWAN